MTSAPASCAFSSTTTRDSANNDGLTSSPSRPAVISLAGTCWTSTAGSTARASAMAFATARSTSRPSSPTTSSTGVGLTEGIVPRAATT